VHGALNLVSKRILKSDGEPSTAGTGIMMNFYEIPKTPFKILDLLSDFFSIEEDRVDVVRNPCCPSPGRDAQRPSCCVPSASNKKNCCAVVDDDVVELPDAVKGEVQTTIHVKGICCAAEIPMIKSVVQPMQGVTNVFVNTTTKLVRVTHDPSKSTAMDITVALNKQKFGATLKKDGGKQKSRDSKSGKSSFLVSGICCSSEIPLIKSILKPLEGVDVEKLSINVPTKTLYVHHEFSLISASGIKDALDSKRFDCQILKDAGDGFRLKPTVMSKYVESTFMVESLFEAKDANNLKNILSEGSNSPF